MTDLYLSGFFFFSCDGRKLAQDEVKEFGDGITEVVVVPLVLRTPKN